MLIQDVSIAHVMFKMDDVERVEEGMEPQQISVGSSFSSFKETSQLIDPSQFEYTCTTVYSVYIMVIHDLVLKDFVLTSAIFPWVVRLK